MAILRQGTRDEFNRKMHEGWRLDEEYYILNKRRAARKVLVSGNKLYIAQLQFVPRARPNDERDYSIVLEITPYLREGALFYPLNEHYVQSVRSGFYRQDIRELAKATEDYGQAVLMEILEGFREVYHRAAPDRTSWRVGIE